MDTLHIGSRREVCWDETLIEKSEGVEIKMHKPEYRVDALACDKPWEGNVCCYFSLIHDDDQLRLYYRGVHGEGTVNGKWTEAAAKAMHTTVVRDIRVRTSSADFIGGQVVTKPVTFTGNNLSMNFATSSLGSVRVRILDTDGNPIDGYDSGNHFGDSLDRPVAFEKSLADLSGKPVRLEFSLKDAELYSFQFA